MKRFSGILIFILIAMLAFTGSTPVATAYSTEARITFENVTLIADGAVVDVALTIPKGKEIADVFFSLDYDSRYIRIPVAEVREGALTNNFLVYDGGYSSSSGTTSLFIGGSAPYNGPLGPYHYVFSSGAPIILAHITIHLLPGYGGNGIYVLFSPRMFKDSLGNDYEIPYFQSYIPFIPSVPSPSYTLTTTASPDSGGIIWKSPNQLVYTPGTVVTLTVSPFIGYTFTGWSGDLSGTTNPTTITMDADKTVTATFSSSTTISGDVDGNGTVTMGDALLLAQSIVGITTLTPAQRLAADVNGDGIMSMADTLQVAQIVVGIAH